jgi:hypothetical protein
VNPIEIANIIGDMIQNDSNQAIKTVFDKAFDESNLVEQFKLRVLFIEEIDKAIENTQKSKNLLKSFEDIRIAIAYPNLNEKVLTIAGKFTSSHIATIEQVLNINDYNQHSSIEEISILNEDLKKIIETEDISTEEKKIILAICRDIDTAKFEHKITGNNALKKLYFNITDKFVTNLDVLTSIKSNAIKNKLVEIYKKIETSNNMINTAISMYEKVSKIYDFISGNQTFLLQN